MKILRLLFLLSLFILFSACSKSDNNSNTQVQNTRDASSTKVPRFAIYDLNGKEISSEAFQGKVVVIDFWATWCKPCITEIPEYNKLYEKFKDKNFAFLGIAMDSGDAEDVKNFAKIHNIKYPIYLGTARASMSFGTITALPTTFVLDQNFNIQKKYVGATPGKIKNIETLVEKILKSQ